MENCEVIEVDKKYLKFFDDFVSENRLDEVFNDDKSVGSVWSDGEFEIYENLNEDAKENIENITRIAEERINSLEAMIDTLDSNDDSKRSIIGTVQAQIAQIEKTKNYCRKEFLKRAAKSKCLNFNDEVLTEDDKERLKKVQEKIDHLRTLDPTGNSYKYEIEKVELELKNLQSIMGGKYQSA